LYTQWLGGSATAKTAIENNRTESRQPIGTALRCAGKKQTENFFCSLILMGSGDLSPSN